jgi:hypothetical protein
VLKHAHHDFASWQTNPVQTPNIVSLKSTHINGSQMVSFFQVFSPNLCTHFSHMCAIWPTHIILLELISLLHNIQNCYNIKNHVNCPDGLWKLTQAWHKMFSFLHYENWFMRIKFLSVHTSTKHSPWCLSRQEIFFQDFEAEFLTFLLQKKCRIFHNLVTFIYHTRRFVGCILIYNNPCDIESYF